ncbi:hypothetical protein ABZ570_22255 [Micromonospora sp. NPDC007271]|uniref:hypothetical protein n=1 Tax=Micromonospora sp. NPDC007271 TaxID=3154587 RepID=UPI00340EDA95
MGGPASDGVVPVGHGRGVDAGPAFRGAGDPAFRSFALIVLRPQAGLLAAIDAFEAPSVVAASGLPARLDT